MGRLRSQRFTASLGCGNGMSRPPPTEDFLPGQQTALRYVQKSAERERPHLCLFEMS